MKTILDYLNCNPVEGEVGLEIEVEGSGLPAVFDNNWTSTHDGSLRGESMEYVFKKPVSVATSSLLIGSLKAKFKSSGAIIKESERSGVHVHINVQDLTVPQYFNMLTIYYIVEEMLVKYCGQSREGNLFCLRLKDSGYVSHILEKLAKDPRKIERYLFTDQLRYGAVNLKATAQYGSLEFRCMRGTTDSTVLNTWIGTLSRIKEVAKTYPSPQEIIDSFSVDGVDVFLDKVLGENKDMYCSQFSNPNRVVLNGLRLIQDVAYATDWEKYYVEEKPAEEEVEGKAHEVRVEDMRRIWANPPDGLWRVDNGQEGRIQINNAGVDDALINGEPDDEGWL